MATHAGSEGVVKTAAKDGTVATVGEVRSYSIESSADVIEDSVMGDTDRTYKVGLKTFTGSLEVFFDETDAEQSRLDVGTEIEFEVYPEGDTSGDTYYAGEAIVTGRSITGSFDGMVEMSITVQGNGALTESTVS